MTHAKASGRRRGFWRNREGASAIEYALLVAMIGGVGAAFVWPLAENYFERLTALHTELVYAPGVDNPDHDTNNAMLSGDTFGGVTVEDNEKKKKPRSVLLDRRFGKKRDRK